MEAFNKKFEKECSKYLKSAELRKMVFGRVIDYVFSVALAKQASV